MSRCATLQAGRARSDPAYPVTEWHCALEALAPLAESPFLGDALAIQHAQPITIAERLEFGGAVHPQGMRYLADSAWVNGPPRDIIAAAKQLITERPSGTRGHAFFDFSLPRSHAPDIAMSLRTDVMIGSYIIYQDEQNDEAYSAWHLDAMKPLEPFTVGQYWGIPTRPSARSRP